jgi:predicted ATPase
MQAKPYLKALMFMDDAVREDKSYPFSIPAVRALETIAFHPDVTFFVGENGSGKSTVLEAIPLALGFGAEGGTKSVLFETAKTTSNLSDFIRPVRSFKKPKDGYYLRAESFFNVATYMDEVGYLRGYGDKSLHARSHGESFMTLLLQKLKGNGLYILDEPEAALSPANIMAAIVAINHLVEQESQFIIATHSPILLAYPRAKIIEFTGDGVAETRYENTAHYSLTKDFLINHKKRIEQLLADSDSK